MHRPDRPASNSIPMIFFACAIPLTIWGGVDTVNDYGGFRTGSCTAGDPLETFKTLRRDMSATAIEIDQALQLSEIIDRCIGDKMTAAASRLLAVRES